MASFSLSEVSLNKYKHENIYKCALTTKLKNDCLACRQTSFSLSKVSLNKYKHENIYKCLLTTQQKNNCLAWRQTSTQSYSQMRKCGALSQFLRLNRFDKKNVWDPHSTKEVRALETVQKLCLACWVQYSYRQTSSVDLMI